MENATDHAQSATCVYVYTDTPCVHIPPLPDMLRGANLIELLHMVSPELQLGIDSITAGGYTIYIWQQEIISR